MKKNQLIALVLAVALCLALCACGSDYPVLDRTLDLADFLNSCYAGSGSNLNLDSAVVSLDIAADRAVINMDKSGNAMDAVRTAVQNSTSVGDAALSENWQAAVDVSSIFLESFSDIPQFNSESIGKIVVHATISFTDNSIYYLRFDQAELDSIRPTVLRSFTKAAKEYLTSQTDKAVSLAIGAVGEEPIENVVSRFVDVELAMLKNGCAGTYTVSNGQIFFDGNYTATYKYSGKNLTLSGETGDGLLPTVAGGGYVFTKS